MSIKVMGQVWDLDLPHQELLVLLALADHADHDGRHAHPGLKLIAWKTGYEERQVRRIIRALEGKKLVVVVSNTLGGRSQTTEYAILLENGVKKSPFRHKPGHPVPLCATNPDIITPFSTETRTSCPPFASDDESKRGTFTTLKGDIYDSALIDTRAFNRPEPSLDLKTEDYLHLGSEDSAAVETHATTTAPVSPVEGSAPPAATKTPRKKTPRPWPDDDAQEHAFEEWLLSQNILTEITPPRGYDWWCLMSRRINGLPTLDWLECEYAKMEMWLLDNPKRKPTPRGTPEFVSGWLERTYKRDRRERLPTPDKKEVHIHYDNNTGPRRR